MAVLAGAEVGALYEAMPCAIVVRDRTGRIEYANRLAELLFGSRALDMFGKRSLPGTILAPDGSELAGEDQPGAQSLRTHAPASGSTIGVVHRDGTRSWLKASALPLLTPDGAVERVVTAFTDITDRITAEDVLARRSRSDAALAELGERAASSVDTDALVRYALELIAEVLGTPLCEVLELQAGARELVVRHGIGWHRGVVGSARVRADTDSQAAATLAAGEPVVVDDVHPSAAQSDLLREHGVACGITALIRFRDRPYGVLGAHGTTHRTFSADEVFLVRQVAALLGAAIQRDRADADLKRRQALLEAIFDRNFDAIILIDDDRRILEANPAACALYGLPREAVVGTLADSYVVPGSGPSVEVEVGRLKELGTLLSRQQIKRADGTVREVEASSHANVRPGVHLAMLKDVTERTRLEAQLLHSQKMESVGRLAGGVAHDFNNLLAVILNYASFVADKLPNDPELQGDLEEIRRAAERGAAVTRQLLIFSRRDLARPEVLSLNEVLSGLANLLRRSVGEDVDVRLDLEPTTPRVRVDRGQLEQAVLNLVGNARDAMPTGGLLTVTTSVTAVGDDPRMAPGRYVVVAVTDTGAGMPPDVVAQAFDPYFTTKPRGQGTGLGLSTVYGIAAQAGGAAVLYSELQRGTSVKIYLPAIDEPAGAATEREVQPALPRGHGERVLVVEDERAVRNLTERILREAGYEVLTARDASEALTLVDSAHGTIDLLLTDLVMPGRSGVELARELLTRLPRLCVLYMSGYPAEALIHRGEVEPSVIVMEKPFNDAVLLRAVRTCLDRSAS